MSDWSLSGRIGGKPQLYKIVDDTCLLKLTQNQVAMVDVADAGLVLRYKWFAQHTAEGTYYAIGYEEGNKKRVQLHRLLLGVTDPKIEVDHISGDRMNNCRSNIRLASSKLNQNNRKLNSNNSTGFNGICDEVKDSRYRVSWMEGGKLKKKSFGYFNKDKETMLKEAVAFRALKDAENDCKNGVRPKDFGY